MGFTDKAKRMAQQAQEKLDEAQRRLSERQAAGSGQADGGQRFDQHSRPIHEDPQPPATPEAEPPSAEPAAPPAAETPAEGRNANPDPFRPLDS